MKILKYSLALIMLVSIVDISQAQFAVKNFDYTELEGKTLLIPTFEANEKFVERQSKRGNFDKIATAKEKAEYYNKIWREAMAESSYDATDYKISGYDARELKKSKDKNSAILQFMIDDYGNRWVFMRIFEPKYRIVGQALINGLSLDDKNDIRLIINMLNESLNMAIDTEGVEGSQKKAMRNKYKEQVVEFYDTMKDKTFLVPEATHKKPEKAAERTADLKDAMKAWKMSSWELTTEDAINEKRVEGDPDSFYWLDIPYYTNNVLITYHLNFIVSTEGDDVLFSYVGKNKLKPATIEQIETKLTAKANRYRSQLGE